MCVCGPKEGRFGFFPLDGFETFPPMLSYAVRGARRCFGLVYEESDTEVEVFVFEVFLHWRRRAALTLFLYHVPWFLEGMGSTEALSFS